MLGTRRVRQSGDWRCGPRAAEMVEAEGAADGCGEGCGAAAAACAGRAGIEWWGLSK